MNRGDSQIILLTINIDGQPITEDYADEIELTFNPQSSAHCVQKRLSKGTIIWDTDAQKFSCLLTQSDTFKMEVGNNSWQLRVLKDQLVASTNMGYIQLGNSNSSQILGR